ncbi:restriction endonuclease subunit S [Elizabethkingia anophelis]|uniref:restriction endonuclease subunit S n=1 Tax=Elizabethkingia anophelis TaxID=1117645 RepID=UPI003891A15C
MDKFLPNLRKGDNYDFLPNLRFTGFENEWEVKKLGEIANKIGDGLHGTPDYTDNSEYYFINGNNLVNGRIEIFDNTKKVSNHIFAKNNKDLKENTLLISINGTIGSIAKYNGEKVMLGKSVGYFNFKNNSDFIYFTLHTRLIQDYFFSELTGSTIKNLSLKTLRETSIYLPSSEEQYKISCFLSLVEDRIQTQRKIIEGLITLKIQSRNKLFKRIIKDDYEAFTVEEILNYEQPTKYIVSNTDYSSDKSLIPVLTANKAFILGYTNEDWGIYNKGKCIVLDDFTLDLKYVDFSFKIKSSAIKLLTPKNNVDLKFVFEYFSFLNLSSNEHKRHYISEIQPMLLNIPAIDIQNNISNFLSKLDSKISLETELLTQYENQKKYLLQNLFV